MKNLGQNGRLSYDLQSSVKKGHNFSYVNRSPILERTRNLVLLTKIWNDGNLLQRTQSSLHTTSVTYLDTAVHATNDECQTLQIPALKASSEWPTRGAIKLNNPYSYFDKGFRPARCYSTNKTRRQYLLCELHFNSLYIFPNKYHFNLKHTNLTITCSLFCIGSCCLV